MNREKKKPKIKCHFYSDIEREEKEREEKKKK
jgi:hypothetical protein